MGIGRGEHQFKVESGLIYLLCDPREVSPLLSHSVFFSLWFFRSGCVCVCILLYPPIFSVSVCLFSPHPKSVTISYLPHFSTHGSCKGPSLGCMLNPHPIGPFLYPAHEELTHPAPQP